MQVGRRFQDSRQVGTHVVAAVVIQSGVEVLLRTLEVAQLRVPLTQSLRYQSNRIVVA